MTPRQKNRVIACMRNLYAQGWTDEAIIIDTAAQIIGGTKKDRDAVERLHTYMFKIFNAN